MPTPNPGKPFNRRRRCALALGLEPLESRMLLTSAFSYAPVTGFTGPGVTGNGTEPDGLIMAPNGDMYGITATGGSKGYGVVFKIAAGTTTVVRLASFNGANGINPHGSLVIDAQGDIFGTTSGGGTDGLGTIFEYNATSGSLTALVSFAGGNGAYPLDGVVADANGDLFGVTFGAAFRSDRKSVLFEWDATTKTLSTLANFQIGIDPRGTVVVDNSGDVFGATVHGGTSAEGQLYEVVAGSGTLTRLASFNGTNGRAPENTLLMDAQGNLIGSAAGGGANNNGDMFEWFASSSKLSVLASFASADQGARPIGTLLTDGSGDIFGVTSVGGPNSAGAVFELSPNGTAFKLTRVHSIPGVPASVNPTGGLVMDSSGDFFGATFSGGAGNRGIIFELLPTGAPQTPAKLVIKKQPANAIAGHNLPGTITVDIEDVFGHLVTGDNGNVTLEIHSGPTTSTLTGTVTVAAVDGVATFSGIEIDVAGNYTLDATDGVRTSIASAPLTVSADASTPHLVFSQPPSAAASGAVILPTVTVKIEDQFGNVITTNDSTVKLTIASGPAGGAIGGFRAATVFNGVASFANLSLKPAGTYTLTAADGNLAPITSGSFVIS